MMFLFPRKQAVARVVAVVSEHPATAALHPI